MRGIATVVDGPGGDANCATGPGEAEDAIVFILPPGYRPEFVEFLFSGFGQTLIVPDAGATLSGQSLPGGAVFGVGGPGAILDGTEFRAAPSVGARGAEDPVDLGSLRSLRRAAR